MGLFDFLKINKEPDAVVPITSNLDNYIYLNPEPGELDLYKGVTRLIASEFAKVSISFNSLTPDRDSLAYLVQVSPNNDQTPDEMLHEFAKSLLDLGQVWFKVTTTNGHVSSLAFSRVQKPGFTVLKASRLRLRKPDHLIDQYSDLLGTLSTTHSGNVLQLHTAVNTDANLEQFRAKTNDRLSTLRQQSERFGAFATVEDEKVTQYPNATQPDGTALSDLRGLIAQELHVAPAILDGSYNETEYRAFYQTHILPLASELRSFLNRVLLTRQEYIKGARCSVVMDLTKVATLSDFTNMAKESIYSGYMTADEIREILGRDPYPDELGDIIFTNKNAVPLTKLPEAANGQGFAADDNTTKGSEQNDETIQGLEDVGNGVN